MIKRIAYCLRKAAYLRRSGGWTGVIKFFSGRLLARRWATAVYDTDPTLMVPLLHLQEEELFHFGGANLLDCMDAELRNHLEQREAWEYTEGVKVGDYFFAMQCGREVVHSGFVMIRTRQTDVLGEPHGVPLIGHCLTIPAARGRGFYPRALSATLFRLRDLGYQRVLIETHPNNVASRRGIEKAGFHLHRVLRGWILFNTICVFQIEKDGMRSTRYWWVR